MPVALDFSVPPFERLTAEERRKLAAAADVAFLQPGEVLIQAGEAPAHLYLIVKGLVSERAGDEVITVHGAGDLVGASALAAPAPATAEVRQETIAQLLPRRLLLDLCRANPAFEAYFAQRLGERLAARAAREATRGMAPLMMAKVGEAFLHPPVIVPAATPMQAAALRMTAEKATSLLVRRADEALGIVTDADLARAALVRALPFDAPIEQVASFPAVTIEHDAFLFRALLLMTQHGVRHMPVLRDGSVIGVLELDRPGGPHVEPLLPRHGGDRAGRKHRRARPGGRCDRAAAGSAARDRHEDPGDRRDGQRSQPQHSAAAVRVPGARRSGGERLPRRHGFGGARRAACPHRPGQCAHRRRRGRDRRRGAARSLHPLHRDADRLRLPALPRQHDGF